MPKHKNKNNYPNRNRRLRVRSVRRGDPDLKRLGRVLIDLATAEAEAEAQRDYESRTSPSPDDHSPQKKDGEAA